MPAALSDLYIALVPELPGCPEGMLLEALRRGAREFCLKTEAWQIQLASINLVADDPDYTLVLPTSYDAVEIRRIVEVRINTAEGVTNGDEGVLQKPHTYFLTQPTTLEFFEDYTPSESITSGLDVKVAVAPPVLTTTEHMDWAGFFTPWSHALVDFAKSYLMRMPGKKWSNAGMATFYLAEFNKTVTFVKAEVERRYTTRVPGIVAGAPQRPSYT